MLEFLCVSCFAPRLLFLFLALATLVEVLDDDSDKHVEHEETDEEKKRYEVDKAPLVMIRLRLNN